MEEPQQTVSEEQGSERLKYYHTGQILDHGQKGMAQSKRLGKTRRKRNTILYY